MSKKVIQIQKNKDIQNTLRNTVDSGMGKSLLEIHKQFTDTTTEDKYLTSAKSMLKYAKSVPQKNLSTLNIQPATRKTEIALILMPKWAVFFAPYNLARLAAVTRAAGYRTSVFDWNVTTWHKLKSVMAEDPYQGHGSRDYLWLDDVYESRLASFVEPILEEYLKKLVNLQPRVIGFSLYYTNVLPTLWLARRIKQLLPNTILIAGGSHIQWNPEPFAEFDHAVKGEGEEVLLWMLDQIEQGIPLTEYLYNADKNKRLNLDELPFPDYSDLDINLYMMPNAISSEVSRGCVAKCTFCQETHYWKYRSRQAPMVLNEVEHQYKTYGTNYFWFIDSLVNGNINELRAFALGVVEKNLNIKWEGYARSDKRMDLEYYKDLAASGCSSLNYGIESGSQLVLDSMKKNTTVNVIERNLKDASSVKISAQTNWIIGYVNEQSNDFAQTLTLLWRIQNYRITSISRDTMNIGPGLIQDNPDFFDVHSKTFLKSWTTKNLGNTKLHRLIRFKCFNIFVTQLYGYKFDSDNVKKLSDTFSIEFAKKFNVDFDLPYEDFDFEIIKDKSLTTTFHKTVVNEVWPLIRTLWRSRRKGAMKFNISFDPTWDLHNYGSKLADNLTAKYFFEINNEGTWSANCQFKFVCHDKSFDESFNYNLDISWQGSGHWT